MRSLVIRTAGCDVYPALTSLPLGVFSLLDLARKLGLVGDRDTSRHGEFDFDTWIVLAALIVSRVLCHMSAGLKDERSEGSPLIVLYIEQTFGASENTASIAIKAYHTPEGAHR